MKCGAVAQGARFIAIAGVTLAALAAGCASGGDGGASATSEDADTGDCPDGTTTGDGATDSTSATDTRPPTDSRYDGLIFDSLDDAPCTPGAVRLCPTTCGTVGNATCVAGDWGKCVAGAGDPCTGLDCTGKGDGFEHTYYTDGDGDGHGDAKKTTQACVPSGTSVASSDDCDDGKATVHPGASEICDKLDNDCNGKTDDDLHILAINVNYVDLPGCTPAESSHASCKVAAASWCRARSSCYDGGFGPVELGATEGQFICVSGGTLTGTWGEVTAAQPACSSDSQAGLRVCESGVNRAARGAGYVGAMLQSHSPGDWKYLAWGSDRAVIDSSLVWGDLTAEHAGCYPGREDTWDCNAATVRYCRSKGHAAGFGPVEYNPTNVAVMCLNK